MKKIIRFNINKTKHKIIIGKGESNKFLISLKNNNSKKFILIDNNIYKKINDNLKKLNLKKITIIKINSSEKIKTFNNYFKISSLLLKNRIDRSSIIISIGGGTLGDLSGFIASTILRGVNFILIPSTLLSQVDSSIGGKNGINSKYAKNQIGTIFQPKLVIIDPIFLNSLPMREIKSGYAEIVKHAIINDNKFFIWLEKNYKKILSLRNKEVIYAINKSIGIKLKYVQNDEKEKLTSSYSRSILNFGHTFGHAIETINNYNPNLNHGEAISTGMILAAKVSFEIGKIKQNELERIINHFKNCSLPIFNKAINKSNFFRIMINDKKNYNGKLNLILLNKIGKAYYHKNFDISKLKNMPFFSK